MTSSNSRLLLPIGRQVNVVAKGVGAQLVGSVTPAQGAGVVAVITGRGVNEFTTAVHVVPNAARGDTSISTTYPAIGSGPQIRIRKVLNPQFTTIDQLPMQGPYYMAQRPSCDAQFTRDFTYRGSQLAPLNALAVTCPDCPQNTTVQVVSSQADRMTVRFGFNAIAQTLQFQLRVRDNNDPNAYWGGRSRHIRITMPPNCP